ncbi:MAG: NAD(P)H-dependent oxidoreductase [Bacteroidota bacterium]
MTTTKILVFGASNSKHSINKKFAEYAARQLSQVELNLVDLNDYESPLYSLDLEKEIGIHDKALKFNSLIEQSEAIVVSLAEYNGLHSTAFKNLWDWLSRIPRDTPMNIWGAKPMFLLSTSPSRRTMNNVLKVSKELFPHFGAKIVADFYLPSFHHFFKDGEIIAEEYLQAFNSQKNKFQTHINSLNK